MNIGLYAYWKVEWDGKTLRTQAINGRYISGYLQRADRLRLFSTIAPASNSSNTMEIQDENLDVVPIHWRTFQSAWLNYRKLRKQVTDHLDGLDVMIIRLFDPCPWTFIRECEKRGIACVFHIVGNPVPSFPIRWTPVWLKCLVKQIIFEPEYRFVFHAAKKHTLLVCGSRLLEHYRHRHPNPELYFESALQEHEYFQQEDSLKNSPPVILTVSILRKMKRIEVQIRALARLKENGVTAILRIVGGPVNTPYTRSLQNLAASLGISDQVVFAGYVPIGEELMQEYRNADIFAFSSVNEGLPRVYLEAASSSLPIVTTDVGGVRDILEHETSALIVPQEDPDAMAEALQRMIEDEALRKKCIAEAYQIAKKYDLNWFLDSMMQHAELAMQKISGKT